MNIAPYIDHTILKPTTTREEVTQVCNEAITHGFAAVCVPPYYVKQAKELVKETKIKVATVIGFPFGYINTFSKLEEIKQAIYDGADELDMVHNLAALKAGDWDCITGDVKTCTDRAHKAEKIIKIIIESGALTDVELEKCCELYGKLGVDFIKTSTGYSDTGATLHAVTLTRKHLPAHISIKASGGIRTFAFAKELIDAGATRIGCSASVKIAAEAREAKS